MLHRNNLIGWLPEQTGILWKKVYKTSFFLPDLGKWLPRYVQTKSCGADAGYSIEFKSVGCLAHSCSGCPGCGEEI